MKAWGLVVALLLVARPGLAQTPSADEVKVGDVIWAPSTAHPEPSAAPPLVATPKPPPKRWYGEPILVADGAAYTCLLLAAAFQMKETSQVFIPPALVAYSLAGPTTHAVRGNWGRATGSLAIRLGVPFVTLIMGALGCTAGDGSGSDCPEMLATFGALGMAGASAIDIAALARERVPVDTQRASWTPTLSLTRQHAAIGAIGQF